MSPLAEALADYLALRRSLGHKLDDAGRQLTRFVASLDVIGAEVITMEAVRSFVLDPELDPAGSNPTRRLSAVRGFARHLAGLDPRTEVPPMGLVSYRARRRVPYLFSDDDVAAVMRAAASSARTPFRASMLETLIGLLAVTGMRVGEALRLEARDIDWEEAVLTVRETKFNKSRQIPVTPDTICALSTYAARGDRPLSSSTRLFVSGRGTPVVYTHFCATFGKAVAEAAVGTGSGIRPRIHDLRHSFAVRSLLDCQRAGRDVAVLLPRLSTYLGHGEPRYTYRYLSATPELLNDAMARLERHREVTS